MSNPLGVRLWQVLSGLSGSQISLPKNLCQIEQCHELLPQRPKLHWHKSMVGKKDHLLKAKEHLHVWIIITKYFNKSNYAAILIDNNIPGGLMQNSLTFLQGRPSIRMKPHRTCRNQAGTSIHTYSHAMVFLPVKRSNITMFGLTKRFSMNPRSGEKMVMKQHGTGCPRPVQVW